MKKILLCYIIYISAALIIAGCTASSTSSRYDKPENEQAVKDNRVRFSDTNDPLSSLSDTSDSYLDEADIDDMPEDESSIDITEVLSRFHSEDNSPDMTADVGNSKEKLLMEIIKYLDTPYKFGGNSKNGIDCSAFTQTVFQNVFFLPLQRTARDQFTQGFVIDRSNLEFGDLVFFNTRRRVRPGHVGIYIGDNLFAHASSKHGVIVSSLEHEYYNRRFMGARRIENALN